MTIFRKGIRWVQDGDRVRRAGSQRPPITSSRKDTALMDYAATSRATSQELGSFARQKVNNSRHMNSETMVVAALDSPSQTGASSVV
ncbi:hypothetical protein TNCV_1118291 [Trichonephila clavipes]|uniref:Uncharacterized protein n=1 Tax=Trichonephila clavipes TaxID=2585209 RepID=A0A8X6T069_TRICX|nr:hypothetical protein TNCV_1118291 [Trichonephila clavipes]